MQDHNTASIIPNVHVNGNMMQFLDFVSSWATNDIIDIFDSDKCD